MVFFNADMVKSTDLAADSNGVIDLQVNQMREEIYTLSKDRKILKLYTMDVIDRAPDPTGSVGPVLYKRAHRFKFFDVSVSNKRNIFLTHPVTALTLSDELDLTVMYADSVSEFLVLYP